MISKEDYSNLFEAHTPGPAEQTIDSLLSIREQIRACGDHWLVRNTLRQKAAALAAQFVDPTYKEPPAPPLRDSKAMAANIDPVCGF